MPSTYIIIFIQFVWLCTINTSAIRLVMTVMLGLLDFKNWWGRDRSWLWHIVWYYYSACMVIFTKTEKYANSR